MFKTISVAFAITILGALIFSTETFSCEEHSAGSKTASSQELMPVAQIGMYLDGYHVKKSESKNEADRQKQIRTAHYCKQVNADLFQCLLYHGNGKEARLIGVEYVITDKLFKSLSEKEQSLWHPHDSEVDSGLLTLPGLTKEKQKEILATLRSTHGKTWQVWPDLSEEVPLGEPVLMWNVEPGKINQATKKSVDERTKDFHFDGQ